MSNREELERELLRAELREAEARLTPQHHVIALATTFHIKPGERLGCFLNRSNIVLRIEPTGLIAKDGTIQVGDRLVAVNDIAARDISVIDLIPPTGGAVTLVLARWVKGELPEEAALVARRRAPAPAASSAQETLEGETSRSPSVEPPASLPSPNSTATGPPLLRETKSQGFARFFKGGMEARSSRSSSGTSPALLGSARDDSVASGKEREDAEAGGAVAGAGKDGDCEVGAGERVDMPAPDESEGGGRDGSIEGEDCLTEREVSHAERRSSSAGSWGKKSLAGSLTSILRLSGPKASRPGAPRDTEEMQDGVAVEVITDTFDFTTEDSTEPNVERETEAEKTAVADTASPSADAPSLPPRPRLGIELGEHGVVVSLAPGLLASKSGILQPGDRIVEVNGVSTSETPPEVSIPAVSGRLVLVAHRLKHSVGTCATLEAFAQPSTDSSIPCSLPTVSPLPSHNAGDNGQPQSKATEEATCCDMGIIDEDGSGKSGCKTECENVASEADEEWVLENGEESSGLVRMESMLKEFAPSKEEDASTAIQESSAVTPRRGLKRSGLGSSGSLAAFLRRLPSISELVAQAAGGIGHANEGADRIAAELKQTEPRGILQMQLLQFSSNNLTTAVDSTAKIWVEIEMAGVQVESLLARCGRREESGDESQGACASWEWLEWFWWSVPRLPETEDLQLQLRLMEAGEATEEQPTLSGKIIGHASVTLSELAENESNLVELSVMVADGEMAPAGEGAASMPAGISPFSGAQNETSEASTLHTENDDIPKIEPEGHRASGGAESVSSVGNLRLRLTHRPFSENSQKPVDLYGFQVELSQVAAYRADIRNSDKEGTMWLSQWNNIMRSHQVDEPLPDEAVSLTRTIHGRVAAHHRPHVWMCLSGARAEMRASSQSYWEMAAAVQIKEPDCTRDREYIKQIDSDLPRTFPQHMGFVNDNPTRQALRRLLVTYADFNPSVGYCQSLNFVAAAFLLVADEEGAFWLLVALCKRVMPDYYTHHLTGLRIDTHIFSSMVAQCMPDLDRHFSELQVPTEILASQWWLCIYANVLPTSALLRVWDAVLSGGGIDSLVAAAFAILRTLEKELQATEDIAGVYAVLADKTPTMWDGDKMMVEMQEAMMKLDPTGQRVAELHKAREARRREHLETIVDGTEFDVSDLLTLGIIPAAAMALCHPDESHTPSSPIAIDFQQPLRESTPTSQCLMHSTAQSMPPSAKQTMQPSDDVLSAVCIDRYFKPAHLASLLSGSLSQLIREKQGSSCDSVPNNSATSVKELNVAEVQELFEALDEERVGVLSLRQILLGLQPRSLANGRSLADGIPEMLQRAQLLLDTAAKPAAPGNTDEGAISPGHAI